MASFFLSDISTPQAGWIFWTMFSGLLGLKQPGTRGSRLQS
jgi:hypothetical protein